MNRSGRIAALAEHGRLQPGAWAHLVVLAPLLR
jgi:hypothetical protein